MSQALNAWMNGELVGRWSVDRGSHRFRYDPSWPLSPRARALSLSLPIDAGLEIQGDAVRHYFDNLLPDNERIRARLGKRFRLKSADTFSLLEAIGRDCVGAVQLLPGDATPAGWNSITCDRMTEDQIVELLQAVPSDATPERFQDDELFRISIAGAQEKTALLRYGAQWCRPHGATPTTHIFKLPLGLIAGSRRVDASDSVQNEWLCAQILRALGLPVAETSMDSFGGQTVLVVERFDRQWMDGDRWIARIPQEDFCQALGVAPDRKYEQHGGPGMARCLSLLQGSSETQDRSLFLQTQLAFALMAATDGHAKNFSLFLQRGSRYQMTPLYDVLSMWPYFGPGPNQFNVHRAGLAMAVRSKNTHYLFNTIHLRHWKQLAMQNGGARVWDVMLALLDRVDAALNAVEATLPDGFPDRTWDAIATGMRREHARYQQERAG